MTSSPNERFKDITFAETAFWVTHRGRTYGPFDYDWSVDLRGIELLYQGQKFGEVCSQDEIFADLKPFRLPQSVCEVASIVVGCVILGLVRGLTQRQRDGQMAAELTAHGYDRFVRRDTEL